MIKNASSHSNLLKTGGACLLLSLGAACGSSDPVNAVNPAVSADGGGKLLDGGENLGDGGKLADGGSTDGGDAPDSAIAVVPTVLSTAPLSSGTDVPVNEKISATFSEAMDATS